MVSKQARDSDMSNCKSKRARVYFIWLGILSAVERGEYAAQMATRLNKSAQLIAYHIGQLKRQGYLETAGEDGKRSYPVFYRLTEKARSFLAAWSNEKRRGRFRFHHFALRYRITRDNPDFLPVSAGTHLRGGVVQVDGKEDGHSVRRFVSPSGQWLYLYSASVYGDQPWQLLSRVSIELDCLGQEISRRHNMELAFEKAMQKPEFDVPSDRFARFWGENVGATVKTPSGSGIDASEGEWALELSVEDAAAYAEMPRQVAEIRQTLDVLMKGSVTQTQRMDILTNAMILQSAEIKKLVESVNKLLNHLQP